MDSNKEKPKNSKAFFFVVLVVVFLCGLMVGASVSKYSPMYSKINNEKESIKLWENENSSNGIQGECGEIETGPNTTILDGFLKKLGDDYIVVIDQNDTDKEGQTFRINNKTSYGKIMFDFEGIYIGDEDGYDKEKLVSSDDINIASPISVAINCDSSNDCLVTSIKVVEVIIE